MNCPYCGNEMEAGWLTATSKIVWDTEPQSGIEYLSDKGFYLARTWIKPSTIRSFYCEDCEVVITRKKDRNPKLRE